MKTIHELKEEKENKVSALLKECKVFFAFSESQFLESKTPLEEGDKYVSMSGGGYIPKSQIDNFCDGMEQINLWFHDAIAADKLRKQHIEYELCNHEAFYTCDISATFSALGGDYTVEEIQAVFNAVKSKHVEY